MKAEMVKRSNGSSDSDYGKNRSDSNSNEMAGTDKTDYDGNGDAQKVETVFGKSGAFVNTVSNRLYNSITRIGDDPHIQGHGSTDSGQDDRENQKQDPSGHASGKLIGISTLKIRNHIGKQI